MKKYLSLLILVSVSSFAMPAQVVLIRHGEKPEVGNDLNAQGYARANALPGFFKTNPVITAYGPVSGIFAMERASEQNSNRAVETVIPTAKALNLPIHQNHMKDDTSAVVQEVMNTPEYNGKTVVICWEHKMIPIFASQFGLLNGPQTWDGNVFDRAWILRFPSGKPVQYLNIGEHVLPSDSSN